MTSSVAEARQHRADIVRYLRRDLEIARSSARLKEEQAQAAALRVTTLEDRLREAESVLGLFQATDSSPGEAICDERKMTLDT